MRPKTQAPRKVLSPDRKPGFLSRQVTEARRYFLNLSPRRPRAIEVVCGGVERCRGDYVMERKDFPYLAVEFVAEGLGTLRLAGRDSELRPGMAFAYGPGVPHAIRNKAHSPMLKYYVDFVGQAAERLLRRSPLGRWEVAQVAAPHEIIEILESLQRNGAAQTRHSAEVCAHLVALLILKISEQTIPFGLEATRAFPVFQRAKQYMERNFLEVKTAEAVAAACHLNVSYLCRLFQRFHHHSPYRFLMRLKMNKAAGLLLDTGRQVKEVASDLDFPDPYTFSRAFKHVYGLSPEAFLKRGQRRGRG
jgi:AraC-like DNA-binding protein